MHGPAIAAVGRADLGPSPFRGRHVGVKPERDEIDGRRRADDDRQRAHRQREQVPPRANPGGHVARA